MHHVLKEVQIQSLLLSALLAGELFTLNRYCIRKALDWACSTLYAVRATAVNFGLHVGKINFNHVDNCNRLTTGGKFYKKKNKFITYVMMSLLHHILQNILIM
jgi:hypothetical protein